MVFTVHSQRTFQELRVPELIYCFQKPNIVQKEMSLEAYFLEYW